jgi:Fe-S cluster assembly protein SufB
MDARSAAEGASLFNRKPLPTWGAELGDIDFDNIKYFVRFH